VLLFLDSHKGSCCFAMLIMRRVEIEFLIFVYRQACPGVHVGIEWMVRACLMLGLSVTVTGALDSVTGMYPILYSCVPPKEVQDQDRVKGVVVFEDNHYSILMGRAGGPEVMGLPVFHALPLEILPHPIPAIAISVSSSESTSKSASALDDFTTLTRLEVFGIDRMGMIPMPLSQQASKIALTLMSHLEKMETLEEEIPSFCTLAGKRISTVHAAAELYRLETASKLAAGRDAILSLDCDMEKHRQDFQVKQDFFDAARSLQISECQELRDEYSQFVDPLQARFNALFAGPLANPANEACLQRHGLLGNFFRQAQHGPASAGSIALSLSSEVSFSLLDLPPTIEGISISPFNFGLHLPEYTHDCALFF
jgi:hypothetical protein